MKTLKLLPIAVISCLCLSCSRYASVEQVEWRGWNAVRISNDSVAVVVNPDFGGNAVYFGTADMKHNLLWTDRSLDGCTLPDFMVWGHSPDAGRFDIGNERKTEFLHDTLWAGKYEVTMMKGGKVILESMPDRSLGLRIRRSFELDAVLSRLVVTSEMTNISDTSLRYCFWTRTLLPSGGAFFCPAEPDGRFSMGYGEMVFEPDSLVIPEGPDERVFQKDGNFMAVPGGDTGRKFGIRNYSGIGMYMRDGFMYIKKRPCPRDGEYFNNEKHGDFPYMIYFNADFIEVEPNSPMYTLSPGETVSDTEIWEMQYLY